MANEKLLGLIEDVNPKEIASHIEAGGLHTWCNAWRNAACSCLPTVDAVEVVHGRWEQVQRWATKAKYRCSVCGREIMSAVKVNIEKYPYCHCGAKMDGDGNG